MVSDAPLESRFADPESSAQGSAVAPIAPAGAAALHEPEPVELSVVIAAKNEAENLSGLVEEIEAALRGHLHYEIVIVDDGSDDATATVLGELARRIPHLVSRRHARACGQSAALRTGVLAARGRLIATLDGDGQNDPADILALLTAHEARAGDVGLVIGWRQKRDDSWSKRKASRIANGIRSRLLGDATPDTGCGLKVFSRSTYLALPYFDHMHRFLPALVRREGLVALSLPVHHRARWAGKSKYGILDRALVGIVDLAGVLWLQRRRRLPIVQSESRISE